MRISFLLPGPGCEPIGGFKVVYEYANGLARRGHEVTVVHAANPGGAAPAWTRFRARLGYLKRRRNGDHGPRAWFTLDPRVRDLWVPTLDAAHVPEGDAVVATAWQTAEWAAGYPRDKGRGYYLIQHRETWAGPEARVMATWKLPLAKVVIARWLQEIATGLGEESEYIPNGLDGDTFGIEIPPAERSPATVLMLHHAYPWKGTGDGLAALDLVRRSHPGLRVTLFGTRPASTPLPGWATLVVDPPQSRLRELYNRSAIFLSPSLAEGWPLPPAEALLSGCALMATDIGGHREYARHEETALLAPARDVEALAAGLRRLVEDRELRLRLAGAGRTLAETFTWDRAVSSFERLLVGSGSARADARPSRGW